MLLGQQIGTVSFETILVTSIKSLNAYIFDIGITLQGIYCKKSICINTRNTIIFTVEPFLK